MESKKQYEFVRFNYVGHPVFVDSYVDTFATKFDAEFAIESFKEKLDRDYYWQIHVSTFEIIEKEI